MLHDHRFDHVVAIRFPSTSGSYVMRHPYARTMLSVILATTSRLLFRALILKVFIIFSFTKQVKLDGIKNGDLAASIHDKIFIHKNWLVPVVRKSLQPGLLQGRVPAIQQPIRTPCQFAAGVSFD